MTSLGLSRLVIALGLVSIAATAGRFALNQQPSAQAIPVTVAVAWSATAVERATLDGLASDYKKLDADLAPVITRSDLRESVIRYVAARSAAISKTQESFFELVRVGHCPAGTPLSYDGVSWTTTETR